jgi:hypothetical protein
MIILFWIGFAVVVGVGANTRGRNGPGWGLLAVLISPLLAGLLLLALPRGTNPRSHLQELRADLSNLRFKKPSFRMIVTAWVVCLIIVGIGIIRKPVVSAPAPKTSTTQFMSPEWTRDFTRRVIDACDLPLGNPDRPAICNLPR